MAWNNHSIRDNKSCLSYFFKLFSKTLFQTSLKKNFCKANEKNYETSPQPLNGELFFTFFLKATLCKATNALFHIFRAAHLLLRERVSKEEKKKTIGIMGACQFAVPQETTATKSQQSYQLKNSDETVHKIFEKIKDIPILRICTEVQIKKIAEKLKFREFNVGDILMKQGDDGKEFFLIQSGHCEVFVNGKKVSELREKDYCGEQALLASNCIRTATVKATQPTQCWIMNKKDFQDIVRNTDIQFINRRTANIALSEDEDESEEDSGPSELRRTRTIDEQLTSETTRWLLQCMKKNLLFDGLNEETILKIISTMKYKVAKSDEVIIEQGDTTAKQLYVIASGTFEILKNGEKVGEARKKRLPKSMGYTFCSVTNLRSTHSVADNSKTQKKLNFCAKCQFCHLYRKERLLCLRGLWKQFCGCLHFFNNNNKGTYTYEQKKKRLNSNPVLRFFDKMMKETNGYATRGENEVKHFVLSEGEWFGELALQFNQPRTATIQASTKVVCLVANSKDFNALFGSLEQVMSKQLEEYQKNQQSDKKFRTEYITQRTLKDLQKGPVIGRGKYGSVQFVKDNQSNTVYALKAIKVLFRLQKKKKKKN
ncbi:hypothetical protein RFI_24563 [Reticulomyxa filosa]|uniref:Cyclic nucleotide-binding domain-containing protein n=1 Tax=Reticulomyxa filosa TaxID=46433 RepID=X6MFM6_RETFI|nr:hypothetical protein RFI_24563 [Reticulomyxa filosa]|eukprot:ETO12813.1 hypothetical protein RFI_24563 [Reticulomyxa filosa]